MSDTTKLTTAAIPGAADGIKAIIELANKASDIEIISLETKGLGEGLPEKIPLSVDHRQGGRIESFKTALESYRLAPERRKGIAKVTTLQSFNELVKRHKDDNSAIFAESTWPAFKLTGVINYHEATEGKKPRHGDHRVVYEFPVTDELKAWMGNNGKAMEQAEFALFLEEHAAELASPFDGERTEYEALFKERLATPTELVALSRNLEVYVGASVKRSERLQTGERTIQFNEEHTNGKGEAVDIPGAFIVQVRAFNDGEPVRIPARLRYRVTGGSVVWFYSLYRAEFWLAERVKKDLALAVTETGLPAFEGTPEG